MIRLTVQKHSCGRGVGNRPKGVGQSQGELREAAAGIPVREDDGLG